MPTPRRYDPSTPIASTSTRRASSRTPSSHHKTADELAAEEATSFLNTPLWKLVDPEHDMSESASPRALRHRRLNALRESPEKSDAGSDSGSDRSRSRSPRKLGKRGSLGSVSVTDYAPSEVAEDFLEERVSEEGLASAMLGESHEQAIAGPSSSQSQTPVDQDEPSVEEKEEDTVQTNEQAHLAEVADFIVSQDEKEGEIGAQPEDEQIAVPEVTAEEDQVEEAEVTNSAEQQADAQIVSADEEIVEASEAELKSVVSDADSDASETSSESEDESSDASSGTDSTSASESASDSEDDSDEEEARMEKLLQSARAAALAKAQAKATTVGNDGTVLQFEEDELDMGSKKEIPIPDLAVPKLPQAHLSYSKDGRVSARAPASSASGSSRPRLNASASSSKAMTVPELDNRPYERQLSKKEKKTQPRKATASELWSTIPTPRADLLPDMKRDYQALALANSLDPKRFMKGGSRSDRVPETFAIGTMVDAPRHLQDTTLAKEKKYRAGQVVNDLIKDDDTGSYAKRKYGDLQWSKMENGRGKGWKKKTKW